MNKKHKMHKERKRELCFTLSDQSPLKPSNWFFSIICYGLRTFKVVCSRSNCYLGCNLAQIVISGHSVAPIGRNLDSKQTAYSTFQSGLQGRKTVLMSLSHGTE